MCGIAGIYNFKDIQPIDSTILENMIEALKHRGPDDNGFYLNNNIGLAHSRLSIIDLSGGTQPIYNEDKSICVVFNGEIFNYIELREDLIKKGHLFYTKSDTEVIPHLYEEYGTDYLNHLIGQFAIALWDDRKKTLLLARDRVGIRPLFYTLLNEGKFLFASEMKSILRHPEVKAEIDPAGINQIFTLWVNIPPRTIFKNINELSPGHFMTITGDGFKTFQYWKLRYPDINSYEQRPLSYYTERLKELIYEAVTLRLRADVPVAAYLSGGIDSSIISMLVKKYHNNNLITFSVAFKDKEYDESNYQNEMVKFINTEHNCIEANYDSIGDVFSDVVKYAEKPMIRTAPAPLYLLSRLVRSKGIKVVLTGEGADEIFGGYNIFKEDKIRRFWAKFPDSKIRPVLLKSLYPYIARGGRADRFWQLFFKKGLTDTNNKYYSHLIRWNNTSSIKNLFNSDIRKEMSEGKVFEELDSYIDPEMQRWHPLCRAQYLETSLFMSGYLLSSQGDRMMMGNSIEGRFPFLDHRVIEFANTIPPCYKIKILNEKYILKETYKDMLPVSIVNRNKQPYRAPIGQCFLGRNNISSSLLTPDKIKEYGLFEPSVVEKFINKFKNGDVAQISARDDMSLVSLVSMQLLHYYFISSVNR